MPEAQPAAVDARPIFISTLLRLSFRLLWRDWRGGELRLLLLALIMAVTSVSGIALFTDRLQQALLLESANMLAADRVFSSRRPVPDRLLAEAGNLGLNTAQFISFTSMAFSDNSNVLVSAKAVSDAYPLRGNLLVADRPYAPGYAIAGGPPPGEVWAESRVLSSLEIGIGDLVYVGEAELRVSRVIVQEPDRQQGGMLENSGPRLMLNLADVPDTNVIQQGSRVSYRYLFAGEQRQLQRYTDWLRAESEGRYRMRDVREESQEVSEALTRAESFLMLGSLFAVLLAGVAIALTAKRYSERHFSYAAILKTLGCSSGQIAAIYLCIQLFLVAIAVIVGSVLGWGVHQFILSMLSAVIPIVLPAASFTPYLLGGMTAVICLLSFALPPLLALKNTSPLRVLRNDIDDETLGARVPYLFGIGGALLLILWYSRDVLLTAFLVLAVAGVGLTLSLLSWLVLRSSAAVGMHAGSAWKLAMSATRRRRKQNVLQIMVFSLTIMSLLTLALLRTDLIEDWQAQLPENTPNHFLMNVTRDQVDGIETFFLDNGIDPNQFYPMATAGLSAINGEPPLQRDEDGDSRNLTERSSGQPRDGENDGESDEDDPETGLGTAEQGRTGDAPRVINRQVTWVQDLPQDNQIVAGEWWGEDPEPGFVSVETDYAAQMGIRLGDTLEFRVSDTRTVLVQVRSMRSVRWDNMQPNFFFIFSPGTIDFVGATYLSTALMRQEQKMLLNDLLRQYPTIVVLEIDALIEQVQRIITQVTSAIELIALLVLACGALVLLACVNATLDERFRENAILRTLGAGRKLILSSLMIEFAFIGFIAGVIATVGSELSLYFLQTRIFQQDFSAHYWVWFAGPVLGTIIIATLGILATRKVVNTSPLAVLRTAV